VRRGAHAGSIGGSGCESCCENLESPDSCATLGDIQAVTTGIEGANRMVGEFGPARSGVDEVMRRWREGPHGEAFAAACRVMRVEPGALDPDCSVPGWRREGLAPRIAKRNRHFALDSWGWRPYAPDSPTAAWLLDASAGTNHSQESHSHARGMAPPLPGMIESIRGMTQRFRGVTQRFRGVTGRFRRHDASIPGKRSVIPRNRPPFPLREMPGWLDNRTQQ